MTTLALRVAVVACLALPAAASAQSETIPTRTVVESSAAMFRAPRNFILRAAQKMPEEEYAFRPTPEVRTFGQLLGHIAGGYTLVCASALGDPLPGDIQQTEKTKTSKAEFVAALTRASEYCNRAHEQLAGAKGAETIDWFGTKHPRATILFFNSSHAWEHCGKSSPTCG